jgi:hypothetical protein
MDVKDDSLFLVSIGDLNTGDYSKVLIEGGKYKYIQKESLIIIDKDTLRVRIWSDSLAVQYPNERDFSIFWRLKPELANKKIEPKYFMGSFVIRGENYVDSLDFINDSILIRTGQYNINFPADKWEITSYSGYNFLNIHNTIYALSIIKSCSENEIKLVYPYHKNRELTLRPSQSNLKLTDLVGEWIEVYDSTKTPMPKPPGINDWEPLYKLNIDEDSIHIKKYRQDFKLKWALTNDGKRIYFPDRVLKNEGSWKILDFNDGILTIRISQYNGWMNK